MIMDHRLPFPLTPALFCESTFQARAEALATPGEGTRPTGSGFFHSRWRTTVHGDSLGRENCRPSQSHRMIPAVGGSMQGVWLAGL
jgi:hypothetical protein